MSSDYYGGIAGEMADQGEPPGDLSHGDWDDEPCTHDCDDDCDDEWGCRHSHCFNCGACGCPGYCDDYVTYNLRPDETGGAQADRRDPWG